eukprot:CAMPEP_0177753740 /NCGR_PEP_ID=MMETSP0491_2-20121128/1624_1 /TAXON_ID=63592 /ORGANISM="Tetraselmis chuii, Strain PLY429" /LENGTH=233 /DNA_ID=CAMNT_0019269051 /DNA_START=94 /DNA_END=792 /DNA_ORIENTATION=+
MPCLYGLVASGPEATASTSSAPQAEASTSTPSSGTRGIVLADYAALKGNFREVGEQCISKLDANHPGKVTFAVKDYLLLYLRREGFIFGVIASADTPKAVAGGVLQQISDQFVASGHSTKAAPQRKGALQSAFGPKIKQAVEYGNDNPEPFDKVAKAQAETEVVRDVVIENIDKLLQRGENLEALEKKTDTLEFQAAKFQKLGKQVHSKMWWQEKKAIAIFAAVSLVVLLVVA